MAVRGGLVQSCPRMLTFLLLSAYFFFAVSCTSCPEEWPSSYWQGKRDFSDSNFTVFTMHDEAWLPNGWGNGFTWSSIPEDKTVPGTKMERSQWGLVDAIIGGQAGWQTPIPTGTIVKIFGFIKYVGQVADPPGNPAQPGHFRLQGQLKEFNIQPVAPDTWYCVNASAPEKNGHNSNLLMLFLFNIGWTQVVHAGGLTMGVFETQEEADKFTCGGLFSACPAGLYRGGCADSSPCIPCGAGKYKAGNDAAGTCIDCQVGKYSNVSGATTCVDCGYEKYSDTTGASSQSACKDCKTCPVGVVCGNCPQCSHSRAMQAYVAANQDESDPEGIPQCSHKLAKFLYQYSQEFSCRYLHGPSYLRCAV